MKVICAALLFVGKSNGAIYKTLCNCSEKFLSYSLIIFQFIFSIIVVQLVQSAPFGDSSSGLILSIGHYEEKDSSQAVLDYKQKTR